MACSFALGVAAARPDGKIVLIEGDGGFLMHVQELEMVKRHGLKVLFVILNDGASARRSTNSASTGSTTPARCSGARISPRSPRALACAGRP